MIVSDVPGTTRDTIDTVLVRDGRTFVLVDTAGLRRKRRQRQGIDYYSELRALEAAERADVALVLVDASEGIVDQDLAVADVARKAGCSTLVVLSKWDIGETDLQEAKGHLNRILRQRPPAVAVSAATGRGLSRLLDHIEELFEKHVARVSTPEFNRALGELKEARPGPSGERGRRLKLMYGTQTGTRPPRLRVFVNDPKLVTRDYGYWVENELRKRLVARRRPRVDRLRQERVDGAQPFDAPGRLTGMRAVILGGGSWGTAFATVLRETAHERDARVSHGPSRRRRSSPTGRNERYLPGISLAGIDISTIADAPIEEAQLVVVAVPSAAFADVVRDLPGTRARAVAQQGSRSRLGRRPPVDPRHRAARLPCSPGRTSPMRSRAGLPAASVLACESLPFAVQLQLAINSITFRVYASDDLKGVELCAAAKNVIALAAGGADGLGLGDNAKAALVARGLAEMARLVESAGARPETFSGLAGMGDLIVTCWSKAGRNRRCGELVAQGRHRCGGGRGHRSRRRGPDDRARPPRPGASARPRDAHHRGRVRGSRRRFARRARGAC